MKTYVFVEKHGNATLVLSAKNDEEANELLEELVVWASEWRLDSTEDVNEID